MPGLNPGLYLQEGAENTPAAREAQVKIAERWMRSTVDDFRANGRTLAANNLDHFLKGDGTDRLLTDVEVERHQPILDAEKVNRKRLEGSLLGITERESLRAGLSRLRNRETREGEWVDLGRERWDRDYTTRDSIRNWLFDDDNVVNRTRKWLFSDNDRGNDDFAVGVGAAKLSAGAQLQGRRLGDELEFRGSAVHAPIRTIRQGEKEARVIGDRYNFNEKAIGSGPARILEDAGRAKPYDVKWTRGERLTAKQRQDSQGNWIYSEQPQWQRLDPDDVGDANAYFRD